MKKIIKPRRDTRSHPRTITPEELARVEGGSLNAYFESVITEKPAS